MGIVFTSMSLLIPFIIIIIIIAAVVKRNNENGKQESFERIVRIVYLYIVVIIALFMIVVGGILTFNSSMDLLIPENNLSYTDITPQEKDERIKEEKNNAIKNIITDVAVLAVALPLFMYHNSKIRELKD